MEVPPIHRRASVHIATMSRARILAEPRGAVAFLLIGVLALAPPATGSVRHGPPGKAFYSPLAAIQASAEAKTRWLCRPGIAQNPCEKSRTATIVDATGGTTIQHSRAARQLPIDCFYVYPTVSLQSTANANRHVDPEERAIARRQASRFSSQCRVFSPMYRQITFPSGSQSLSGDPELAYTDVRRAWQTYLSRFNHGRGVVLIGHSQGSFMLDRLIQEKIDAYRSARKRLVSALLLGGNVTVRKGSDRGGDFKHVPACSSWSQIGCVVAYSTFNETPPDAAYFGRLDAVVHVLYPWVGSGDPDTHQVLCVNPAAIGGGSGALHPHFVTEPFPGPGGPFWDSYNTPPSAPTPWVTYPDLYRARCQHTSTFAWLQIDDVGGAGDARPRVELGDLGPNWGLHAFDVNLALGNLVGLVRREAKAYVRRQP